MTILSDRDIESFLKGSSPLVSPLAEGALQPASIDVRLGDEFVNFKRSTTVLDPTKLPEEEFTNRLIKDHYVLHPGQFVLGRTLEVVNVPPYLALDLVGKSSLARFGLLVQITAGWIDPGFRGTVVLELRNVGPRSLKLTPGMFIGQLLVHALSSEARSPYGAARGSHYQDQGRVETAQPVRRTDV